MKIFGHHIYILFSQVDLDKEKREQLCRGLAHIHSNPLRLPVIRYIRDAGRETARKIEGLLE